MHPCHSGFADDLVSAVVVLVVPMLKLAAKCPDVIGFSHVPMQHHHHSIFDVLR